MKKKLFLIAATFMLMFSFAGQAMASFAAGDLIQVVLTNDGSGSEVVTDLGSFTSNTTSGSITDTTLSNTVDFTTNFSGQSLSNLNVVYFVADGSNTGIWVTGNDGGQSNSSGKKSGTNSALTNLLNYYASLGSGSQVVGASSDTNSYWSLMDKGGVGVGTFDGFIHLTADADSSLAALATTGYVDQYLYYYAASTLNSAKSGVEIADIRTFADGHTEIIPLVSTPLPAAVWLLGSGLMCLVGIRRRETAV
ncbi:MAG TPA: VPLPA-CTERM sorting domain-containing protein [Smithella sp.]|nr:VPLPA-CTERM sorting domain-containing protein [Smithella sp.]